ncbi:MAG TPA: phospholipase D-like domain-containing protein [Candidatus Saccharimonadia bacterium]|jgi:cardiolipin synthase
MSSNPFIHVTEAAAGSPYRPGNSLIILQNGDEIFPSMLEAVREAKSTIEFSTYVYWRSHIANEFADALCERARAGVKVRLLVDAVGAAVMSARTVWQLERAGVKLGWFRPVRWPYLQKFNNRSHRKILIVDGNISFTGGVGIADEWTGAGQDAHHWRETHCRITGPACADLRASFAENWAECAGEQLPDHPPVPINGHTAVQVVSSTAGRRLRPTSMEKLVHAVIDQSRERLWITSAYFVPSEQIIAGLIRAAGRGVDVRVLTNGPLTNHKITRQAGRASYAQLLAGSVKLYEYRGMHHGKIITADSSWATIGSTNLDDRSLVLNDELNVAVTDLELVAALDRSFRTDLEHATHIQPATWPQRGRLARLAEAGANLFRTQL